jgi:hypothetical protein
MNDVTWKYLAFVVAVSILIWGVLELSKRLYRQGKGDPTSPTTWIKLDAEQEDVEDEEHNDREETPESDLKIRAQQNGHHSKTMT